MRALTFLAAMLLLATAQAAGLPGSLASWWLTPDQQGQRLMERGQFAEAAAHFEDPSWRGTAYYRAGDFERAAAVFGRLRTPEAALNRGNALVMLGRYDEAIESYQQALQRRPGWQPAQDNLAIAVARQARLAPPESDAGGTGGMLEADEIVFDDSGRVERSGAETVTEGGEPMSDEEMRAVWLRRVQNNPADFLRARFAWQLHRRGAEEAGDGTRD